ncbi:hypothetical protein Vafri_17106, partial [Volvox africanus]
SDFGSQAASEHDEDGDEWLHHTRGQVAAAALVAPAGRQRGTTCITRPPGLTGEDGADGDMDLGSEYDPLLDLAAEMEAAALEMEADECNEGTDVDAQNPLIQGRDGVSGSGSRSGGGGVTFAGGGGGDCGRNAVPGSLDADEGCGRHVGGDVNDDDDDLPSSVPALQVRMPDIEDVAPLRCRFPASVQSGPRRASEQLTVAGHVPYGGSRPAVAAAAGAGAQVAAIPDLPVRSPYSVHANTDADFGGNDDDGGDDGEEGEVGGKLLTVDGWVVEGLCDPWRQRKDVGGTGAGDGG